MIFKALNPKEEQPYRAISAIQPSPSTQPTSVPTQAETLVDGNKPKSKPDPQWKAPWLNIQRNKQRQGSSDNVIKSHSTAPSQKPYDAASILKDKLEAKMKQKLEESILNAEVTTARTEIPSAKRESSNNSQSGMRMCLLHTCIQLLISSLMSGLSSYLLKRLIILYIYILFNSSTALGCLKRVMNANSQSR